MIDPKEFVGACDFDTDLASSRIEDKTADDWQRIVEKAVSGYKWAKSQIAEVEFEVEPLMKHAKEVIQMGFAALGTTKLKTSAGQVYIPEDGATVSYDAKALDTLCQASPELKALLWVHRTEKVRQGAMTIK